MSLKGGTKGNTHTQMGKAEQAIEEEDNILNAHGIIDSTCIGYLVDFPTSKK